MWDRYHSDSDESCRFITWHWHCVKLCAFTSTYLGCDAFTTNIIIWMRITATATPRRALRIARIGLSDNFTVCVACKCRSFSVAGSIQYTNLYPAIAITSSIRAAISSISISCFVCHPSISRCNIRRDGKAWGEYFKKWRSVDSPRRAEFFKCTESLTFIDTCLFLSRIWQTTRGREEFLSLTVGHTGTATKYEEGWSGETHLSL